MSQEGHEQNVFVQKEGLALRIPGFERWDTPKFREKGFGYCCTGRFSGQNLPGLYEELCTEIQFESAFRPFQKLFVSGDFDFYSAIFAFYFKAIAKSGHFLLLLSSLEDIEKSYFWKKG